MTKHQTQIRGMVMLSLCLVLGLAACSTTAYKAPINQFNEASTVVVETSRAYINDVNKVERDKTVNQLLSLIYKRNSCSRQMKLNCVSRL